MDLMPIVLLLLIANVLLTSMLVFRPNVQKLLPRLQRRPNFQPIRHARVDAVQRPYATKINGTTLSYWQERGSAGNAPFVAMYFRKSGIFDGIYVPEDSYFVTDTSNIIPRDQFEKDFEQSKVATEIPLRNGLGYPNAPRKVMGAEQNGPPLSDEESAKLAREYELE